MKIAFLILRCRLAYLVGAKSPYSASWATLRSSHSYRLASTSHTDKLIGFRYLRAALKMIFADHQSIPSTQNKVGLFRGGGPFDSRVQYLAGLNETVPDFLMCREDFNFNPGTVNKLNMLLGLFILAPGLLLMTIISKKRGTYGGIITDYVEITHLLVATRKREIHTMWLFDSYERDSNLMSLALMKQGCKVIRVPAANLLITFYHHVVCSEFIFTAPFQHEELETLKENWHVDNVRDLPMLSYPRLLDAPRKSKPESLKTLGFISSGVWRRKQRGELASGLGEYESEDLLIDTLNKYLIDRPDIELLIYLHPCEKESDALFAQAREKYATHFPANRFRIVPRDMPSLQVFVDSEIAVSVYSAANLERLFLGMKTLFFPACFDENIYANTSIEKISADNPDSLVQLLDAGFEMDKKSYFAHYGLNSYYGFGLPSHLRFKD